MTAGDTAAEASPTNESDVVDAATLAWQRLFRGQSVGATVDPHRRRVPAGPCLSGTPNPAAHCVDTFWRDGMLLAAYACSRQVVVVRGTDLALLARFSVVQHPAAGDGVDCSGPIAAVRFRRRDGALVIGTSVGEVFLCEHDEADGSVQLWRRQTLVGTVPEAIRLLGVGETNDACVGDEANPAASTSVVELPDPPDTITATHRSLRRYGVVVVGATRVYGAAAADGIILPAELVDPPCTDGSRRRALCCFGERSPSGRFMAIGASDAAILQVVRCSPTPASTDRAPAPVLLSVTRDDVRFVSVSWKPDTHGTEVLVSCDSHGRLWVYSPSLDGRSFDLIASTPHLESVQRTAAAFVRPLDDGGGGIAQDRVDLQNDPTSALDALQLPHRNGGGRSDAPPPYELAPRLSFAVHFVGQYVDGELFLWRLEHLNDQPYPRYARIKPDRWMQRRFEGQRRCGASNGGRQSGDSDQATAGRWCLPECAEVPEGHATTVASLSARCPVHKQTDAPILSLQMHFAEDTTPPMGSSRSAPPRRLRSPVPPRAPRRLRSPVPPRAPRRAAVLMHTAERVLRLDALVYGREAGEAVAVATAGEALASGARLCGGDGRTLFFSSNHRGVTLWQASVPDAIQVLLHWPDASDVYLFESPRIDADTGQVQWRIAVRTGSAALALYGLHGSEGASGQWHAQPLALLPTGGRAEEAMQLVPCIRSTAAGDSDPLPSPPPQPDYCLCGPSGVWWVRRGVPWDGRPSTSADGNAHSGEGETCPWLPDAIAAVTAWNGMLYVAHTDGTVAAYALDSGELVAASEVAVDDRPAGGSHFLRLYVSASGVHVAVIGSDGGRGHRLDWYVRDRERFVAAGTHRFPSHAEADAPRQVVFGEGGDEALWGGELFVFRGALWQRVPHIPTTTVPAGHSTALLANGWVAMSDEGGVYLDDLRPTLRAAFSDSDATIVAHTHTVSGWLAAFAVHADASSVSRWYAQVTQAPLGDRWPYLDVAMLSRLESVCGGAESAAAASPPWTAMRTGGARARNEHGEAVDGSFVEALGAAVQEHAAAASSMDAAGSAFLLLSSALTSAAATLPAGVLQCAVHSSCEEALAATLFGAASSLTWERIRSYGGGYWIRSETVIRPLVERVARTAFNTQRQPRQAALWYVALRKPAVLGALFRSVGETALAAFFSGSNFEEHSVQTRACKNAFRLLARHDYALSAALFLLGGDVHAALQVVLERLQDVQLALWLSRLWGDADVFALLLPPPLSRNDEDMALLLEWLRGDVEAVIARVADTEALRRRCADPRPACAWLLQVWALRQSPRLHASASFVAAWQRTRRWIGRALASFGWCGLAWPLLEGDERWRCLGRWMAGQLRQAVHLSAAVRVNVVRGVLALPNMHSSSREVEVDSSATSRRLVHHLADALLYSTADAGLEPWQAWALLATEAPQQCAGSLRERFVHQLIRKIVALVHEAVTAAAPPSGHRLQLVDAADLMRRLQALPPAAETPWSGEALAAAHLAEFVWLWQQSSWTPLSHRLGWTASSAGACQRQSVEAEGAPPAATDAASAQTSPAAKAVSTVSEHRQDEALSLPASVEPHGIDTVRWLCLVVFLEQQIAALSIDTNRRLARAFHRLYHTAVDALDGWARPLRASAHAAASTSTARVGEGDAEAFAAVWAMLSRMPAYRPLLERVVSGHTTPGETRSDREGYLSAAYPIHFGADDGARYAAGRRVLLEQSSLLHAMCLSSADPATLVVATDVPGSGLRELHLYGALEWDAFHGAGRNAASDGRGDGDDAAAPSVDVVRELRAGMWHGRAAAAASGSSPTAGRLQWRQDTVATALASHPLQPRYVSADADGALVWWAFGEPISMGTITPASGLGRAHRLRFSMYGEALLSAHATGTLALWKLPETVALRSQPTPYLSWMPFGGRRLHDACFVNEASVVAVFGSAGSVTAGALRADAGRGGTVRVFDLRQDVQRAGAVLAFPAHSGSASVISAAASSPTAAQAGDVSSVAASGSGAESLCGLLLRDRTRLLSGADDGTLTVCDLRMGLCSAQFVAHPTRHPIRCMAAEMPRARAIVTGSEAGDVRLWDARTLRLLDVVADAHRPSRRFRSAHRGGALFSVHGTECAILTDYSLLTCGGDGRVQVFGPGWRAESALPKHSLRPFLDEDDLGDAGYYLRRASSGMFDTL